MRAVVIRAARRLACACLAALSTLLAIPAHAADELRVAVVGGLELCGVWERLIPRIEAAVGVHIVTVSAAPKETVVPEFRDGRADLLLIHGGDETFGLEAEGFAAPARVWAFNEHVIVGPVADPAQVATAASASEAFARIAKASAPFVAFRDPGSHAIVQRLWRSAGIRQPASSWVLPDETANPREVLNFAAKRGAYVVVGNIPVAFGRLRADGMKVLLKGDPAMRRAYVVVEPGPGHSAHPEIRGAARRVADYLVSAAGQADLVTSDAEANGPWIFPLPQRKGPGSSDASNSR